LGQNRLLVPAVPHSGRLPLRCEQRPLYYHPALVSHARETSGFSGGFSPPTSALNSPPSLPSPGNLDTVFAVYVDCAARRSGWDRFFPVPGSDLPSTSRFFPVPAWNWKKRTEQSRPPVSRMSDQLMPRYARPTSSISATFWRPTSPNCTPRPTFVLAASSSVVRSSPQRIRQTLSCARAYDGLPSGDSRRLR
jgi:hypothetical protein